MGRFRLVPSWLVVAHPERDIRFYSSSPATDTLTLAYEIGRVNLSRLPYRYKKPLSRRGVWRG